MKKTIAYGSTSARSIDVYILIKNNQKYIPHFVENMAKFESIYDVDVSYYILENDSSDSSLSLIKEFMKSRKGMIVYPGGSDGFDNMNRLKRMEFLRNTLIDCNREKASDWSVLIDSDIYFQPDTIEQLLRSDPKGRGIGMLCAYGVEFYERKDSEFISLNHYYDTYTYIDNRNHLYWPHCIFNDCQKCSDHHVGVTKRSPEGVIDVVSAFGGFALVDTQALRNSGVRWKAIPNKNIVMCEHIGLCLSIRDCTGLSVAIDCGTKVFWEIPSG